MIRAGVECGQRWWRPSSWRQWDRKAKRYRLAGFRTFRNGFAIGPIMFWRG